jgi:hypothetical protein
VTGDAATGEVASIAGGAIEVLPWTDETMNCSFSATLSRKLDKSSGADEGDDLADSQSDGLWHSLILHPCLE